MTIRGVTEDLNDKTRVKIKEQPILNNEMDILNIGMDWQDPSAPNYRYILYLNRKLIKRGTKGIQSICSATHIREVTKDLTIELRVNIEKQPILNNEMDILNNGMDCCDPLAPNYR